MKREEIIKYIESEFPIKNAYKDDFIGLQIKGVDEINSIMLTLDLTLDVINQAIENEIDLIITHHPFFFGKKEELIKLDPYLKSKKELLEKANINVYVIHTNIDFSEQGISNYQAKQLKLKNINISKNKEIVFGELELDYQNSFELIDYIKENLNIENIRTNITSLENKKQIAISSGASGDNIYDQSIINKIFIVGELKWHHWIYANEMGISIIEIGHFSEAIVKSQLNKILNDKFDLKILESVEENGYWQI